MKIKGKQKLQWFLSDVKNVHNHSSDSLSLECPSCLSVLGPNTKLSSLSTDCIFVYKESTIRNISKLVLRRRRLQELLQLVVCKLDNGTICYILSALTPALPASEQRRAASDEEYKHYTCRTSSAGLHNETFLIPHNNVMLTQL